MYMKPLNFLRPLTLIGAAAFALGAVNVGAQQMPEGHPGGAMAPKATGSDLMQQVQAKQAEIQQLNQQLMDIQRETMEANPALAEQRDELVSFVDEKMAETGYDAEAAQSRIEKLQGEVQGGDLSAEEQQQHRQQLRQEMSSMQQAQSQVMQDQEFLAKREALNESLVEAMQKHNPQTEELISKLQAAQQEFQQLAQRAHQATQQGGGSQ